MSEHGISDPMALRHLYNSLRNEAFEVDEFDGDRLLFIETSEELDATIEKIFGIGEKSPKYIERLFVVDYEDQIVWEQTPFVMEKECKVSSVIQSAAEFGTRVISDFESDYSVCLQLYIDGRSLAIRYAQKLLEDNDLVEALMPERQDQILSVYEVLFTPTPERIDWTDDQLSISRV